MTTVAKGRVTAVALGIMQDGGLPHVGCGCARCAAAQADRRRMEMGASLAIVDGRRQPAGVWLVDASPDIRFQLYALAEALGPDGARPGRLRPPDGIFLTHGHMGHVAGLAQFGPEAMHSEGLPVYGPPGVIKVIEETALWRPLLANLRLEALEAERPLALGPGLEITAVPVPHRDEWGAGTVAYCVQGPGRSLLYLPDIDAWEEWPAADRWLGAADVALVDGTFFSAAELGGRRPVAHPLVPETLARFAGRGGRLALTHLNHTNPILDEESEERAMVYAAGAEVARTGMVFELG